MATADDPAEALRRAEVAARLVRIEIRSTEPAQSISA
jgi:hypothetical protein